PSTASAAGLPDSALLALAVPASAQFTVGAAPPPPSARAPWSAAVLPALRAVLPSGRACATVPVAATTASGTASTNAQAAATTRGRRPPASTAATTRGRRAAVSTAAHLVLDPGSLDLSIKFPFEPTRLWPQVDIFARAPTTGNRLPYGFQQKIISPNVPGRVPPVRLHALPPEPRLRSTPSHRAPAPLHTPPTEPRPRSTPLPPVNPADRRRPPTGAERRETGHSVRSNALEPGFHAVLASPERELVMLMGPVLTVRGLREGRPPGIRSRTRPARPGQNRQSGLSRTKQPVSSLR